ncbi:TPM domain-containing protein [Undibacterium fentianense]|uniref:TPM domain-containing protein n=1 Tax=Undibacterium fentianense TaxID=2828728 RepID=A0A941DXQ4_9BURK|nr:TPM domain-containing protein [Undibacterium fentianense]MBR7799374.1 TPM domain-containing protein [Undibacterium fentianense]
MQKLRISVHFLWLILLPMSILIGSRPAYADQIAIPKLTQRVTDLTQTLTTEQTESLAQKLALLEKTKGSQIAILLIPTTGEESIEQYSIRVVDEWKIGRKGTADGALFLIAKNDKRMRIEVGRGLEGALTDVASARIIREFVRPAFKQNDFFGGINLGVDKIITVIEGEPLPAPEASQGHSANFTDKTQILGVHPLVWLVLLIFGLILSKIVGPWPGRGGLGIASAGTALFAGAPIAMAALAGLAMVVLYSLLASRLFWDIAGTVIQSGTIGGFGGGHSSDESGSSNDSFSGGGGDFGGGGASGDW